jgi:hypothetical protein
MDFRNFIKMQKSFVFIYLKFNKIYYIVFLLLKFSSYEIMFKLIRRKAYTLSLKVLY